MTDEALDVFARQLLLDASHLEVSSAPQEKHTFSPDFERKMKKMIRRVEHPVRHRVGQAVACVLLVAVLGFSSVMAFSAEARAAVFGWIREVYETYFLYHYEGGEAVVPENAVFKPAWVPEGYLETVAPEPGDSIMNIYENEDGALIMFFYTYNSEAATLNVEHEGSEIQQIFIGDIPAELYVNRDETEGDTLVWTDKRNGILCWITADLPAEDLIKMAESVELVSAAQLTLENSVYLPAWLPEGFELVMEPEPGDVSASIYANDTTGEKFTIQYAISSEGTIIEVERDQVDAKSVFVGDWPADLYLDRNEGEPNVLVWENTDVGAMFLISADLPQEDIIRIAESLELVEVEE